MDDYNSNLLNDSKSEWSIRLMNILSGHIIDGFRSIFSEAMEVCEKNDEAEKYLMTFQNYLSMIPKWNQNVVDAEVERIKESSQCKYLEDLITCVHIIQLKILSCVRTGNHNKKIDIDIPCFKSFLHNVYINIARKLYSNIYLFQIDVSPLQQQKHNREFEIIVQTCIMNTVRDNIPVEQLLKQYIDETQEVDVEKVERIVKEDNKESEKKNDEIQNIDETKATVESNNTEVDLNKEPDNNDNVTQENKNAANDIVDLEKVKPPTVSDSSIEPTNNIENNKGSMSISFEDNEEAQNERLTFGENVPLIVDGNFGNEMEEVSLDFDTIEDNNQSKDDDVIDLGIEELVI